MMRLRWLTTVMPSDSSTIYYWVLEPGGRPVLTGPGMAPLVLDPDGRWRRLW